MLHRFPWYELAALTGILGVFGLLALPNLALTGLYYDEAADAVPAMQLLLGHTVETVRGSGITVLGRTFPVMAFDYVGPVHTYAAVPFFVLFGANPTALRLMTVAGGAATVILTYYWVRDLSSSRTAGWIAALLLAVHPSFVYYVRQGVHVSSLLALWMVAALWLLLRWRRGGGAWALVTGVFLLGVGVTTKVLFAWVIVALAVIGGTSALAASLWPSSLKPGWPSRRTLTVLVAAAAFIAGCAPLVIYNLQTGGTLEALARGALVSQHGVDNTRYFENLRARLDSFRLLLDGGHFWFLGGIHGTVLNPLALVAALVVLAASAFRRVASARQNAAAGFLVAFMALVLLQSPLTLSDIYPTHLFLLLPIVAAAIAIAAQAAGTFSPLAGRSAIVAALLLATANAGIDLQYRASLVASGGLAGHSDTINRLASYLDEHGIAQPYALDWGMKYSIELLTQDRVKPVEVFGYYPDPDPGFGVRMAAATAGPGATLLFHEPSHTVYHRFDALGRILQTSGQELKLVQSFRQRDGTPIYLVYEVQ
ncbi:MAG: phospholipid carrier-dependent glycosyltransferase [Dehalococcoidia bacterium]|nr:phospholipid carrier-dependent glycosyltransferase [Dehalococcoidia bacterium]